MHLGLIEGPHNLISAQESPVPFPKFHMATRLKILMACGSKKVPRYIFLSLKSPVKRNPSRFHNRAPIKKEARLKGILHLSPLPSLKIPVNEPLSMFSNRIPVKTGEKTALKWQPVRISTTLTIPTFHVVLLNLPK
jgi:hypothetical protein